MIFEKTMLEMFCDKWKYNLLSGNAAQRRFFYANKRCK